MSKFIDALSRGGQQSPEPMGFGSASRARLPSMLLVGVVDLAALARKRKAVDAGVDAVLVSVDQMDEPTLDRAIDKMGDLPWGVRAANISSEDIETLAEEGCDFVVFEPECTDASLLGQENLGKVVVVEQGLDRDRATAIAALSMDAVLVTAAGLGDGLTVGDLFDAARARAWLAIPLLLSASREIEPAELAPLRDAGVGALLTDLSDGRRIQRMREAIAALPPRKRGRRPSYGALIPSADGGAGSRAAPPPDDEDDWEE